jgi:methylenetetrahydrofolate dehydrogenase (NADP+)/methenyltetrahydrofolate cyclohydrolase
LATVTVGDDYRAGACERWLARVAIELGVPHRRPLLPATCTQAEVVAEMHRLNDGPWVTGILVLPPLPEHLSEAEAFRTLPR